MVLMDLLRLPLSLEVTMVDAEGDAGDGEDEQHIMWEVEDFRFFTDMGFNLGRDWGAEIILGTLKSEATGWVNKKKRMWANECRNLLQVHRISVSISME